MKAVVLPILLTAAAPSAADDFKTRWDAIEPPSIGIMAEMPVKPHAVRVTRFHRCHRVWFTRHDHRYWRCRQ
jgi:hypothetical protein